MKTHDDDLKFEPKHKKHSQADIDDSDEQSKSDLVKAIGSIDVSLPSGEIKK